MKFYYSPNSIAVATGVTLCASGLEFEAIRVDFSKGEQQSPEYLTINPKGRVPALVTDRGILTETGAVLEYIATLAPDAGLMPAEPFEAARVRSIVHYIATTMHVNHAHKMRGARWANEEASLADMRAKVAETMGASAAYIEAECLIGPFCMGDQMTIADCHLFAVARWLEGDGVAIEDYPKLAAFMAHMRAHPAVARAFELGIFTE